MKLKGAWLIGGENKNEGAWLIRERRPYRASVQAHDWAIAEYSGCLLFYQQY